MQIPVLTEIYTDNPVDNEINLNEVDKENELYNSDNSVLTFFTATNSVNTDNHEAL